MFGLDSAQATVPRVLEVNNASRGGGWLAVCGTDALDRAVNAPRRVR